MIAAHSKPHIPALCDSLTDKEKQLRIWSVKAFGSAKYAADLAATSLIAALGDELPGVRKWAARALENMRTKEAIGPLTESILDDSPAVRAAACWAIEVLRKHG